MKDFALILSGGGAKGAFQVGVLSQFEKNDIHPKIIYGTSVGALNAYLYSKRGGFVLEEVWREIESWRDLFRFNWSSLWGSKNGFLNQSPLERLMKKHGQTLMSYPVIANVTNLSTGQIERIWDKDLRFEDMVLASSAIPGLIQTRYGFCDGMLRDNTPLKPAIEDGYKKIIVILNDPRNLPIKASFSISEVLMRSFDIMNNEMLRADLEECQRRNEKGIGKKIDLTVIEPETFIEPLDFSKKSISKMIEHGKEVFKGVF